MFYEFVPKEKWRVGIVLDDHGNPKYLPITKYTELDDLYAYEGVLYCDARVNGYASVKRTKGKTLKEVIPWIQEECRNHPEKYFPGLKLWCIDMEDQDWITEKKYKIIFGNPYTGYDLRIGCLFQLNENGTLTGIDDVRFEQNQVGKGKTICLTDDQIKELQERVSLM